MAIWFRQTGCAALLCAALLLVFLWAAPGIAQQASLDLQQQIEALKQGQQAIQKELQEIKQLLQARQRRRPAGPDVKGKVFSLHDRPVKGEQTAMLTLIDYTDYQ